MDNRMLAKKKSSKTELTERGNKLRLHGTVARDLGIQIVSGRLKPGHLLDNEIAASERLRVSRTAYREAIRILSAKGMLYSLPKVGTHVAERNDWHLLDTEVLAWIFDSDPDDALLADLFDLRKIVEPGAAAFAALRRTHAHLAEMQRALKGMAEHKLTTEAGRLADQDFHSALLHAGGNAFLISMISGISAAISWTTVFKHRKNQLARDPMPDHQSVYDAIEAGDPRAAFHAMYKLIDLAFIDTKGVHSRKKRAR